MLPVVPGYHHARLIASLACTKPISLVLAVALCQPNSLMPLDDELRNRGHEYGTNTGRERRCGWFDAVAGRFVAQLNGLDAAVITKLDVLDTFPTIKICTAYQLHGKTVHSMPANPNELAACEPVYEEMEGWQCKTSSIVSYDELPTAAKNYLKRLEELLETPIAMISVSPQRGKTIQVKNIMAARNMMHAIHRNAMR